jgi:hypothetical protein
VDFCAELALRARVQDLTSKKQDLNTAFKYGISVQGLTEVPSKVYKNRQRTLKRGNAVNE